MTENLVQDLGEEARPRGVYAVNLLFREACAMPTTVDVLQKLTAKFGPVDLVSANAGLRSFALPAHTVEYAHGVKAPAQLLLGDLAEVREPLGDAVARSQFWDCPNGVELLDSCPWQVLCGDFMAGGLPALERADLLADWLELLLELFPSCEAVYFQPSGKLMPAPKLRENPYTGPLRLLWGGLNARFFTIQGTEEMLVDTLGLYILGLPDVQYHFHTLEPNAIVNHAYNTAIYQFEHDAPIENGHTIGGLQAEERWLCRYEDALVQPARGVLDIAPGPYAAGNRN